MSTDKPVVFLAFANEYEVGRRLDNVVKEREQLEAILHEAYRNGLCDKPIVRQNVSIKTFLDILGSDEYKNRIAIIHYGGHADGYQLLLEGLDGKRQVAKGDGLVNILAKRENQENMKLVFLNGCSTERLAKALTDRGVPIVIGTSTSIKDDQALTVATRFYTGLANGLTMAGAWADAKHEVESVSDAADTLKEDEKTRGIVLPDEAAGNFPWEESFRDSAAEVDFKNWNLPEEAKNPTFNLPPLEKRQLPTSPFLFLKPYEARHAEIFFGRSNYIRDLWLKVDERDTPPIIMLYGESGAGKSSLLDAGLVPRLENAKKKNGEKRFEVRYMRRDQDEGLVRTLAQMLSFEPAAQAEEQPPTGEAKKDPNLEKLQQIESIAKELEEETANTLQAVINQYRANQAYKPKKGNSQELYHEDANGSLSLDQQAGARLRKAWIKLEEETGRELVIILDQVEEAITQPHPKIEKELTGLLMVLKDIFVRPAAKREDKIRGKIILGYREEFNAKILARSQDYELSPSTVFLEQLKQEDIEDIFRELPKVKGTNHYNLTIEKGLPDKVANDVLKGRSAVAPVLQLLLTKLWENTYDEDKNSAHFSTKAYNETQSGGREMEKYFREQMEAVREWNPGVVESGLVLDILQFHVTELGTSRRRHFEKDIHPRYQHLEEEEEYDYSRGFVETLIKKLKSPEIFLLNDEGRGYTSLPHDTLAPVVRREYDRSDKFGQRSARILEVKKPDLERAIEEKELRNLRLNDNDLEVVWRGKKGMRNLNTRERALLEISRKERDKRLRQRRAWTKAGIVGGLFILALSILAASLSVSVNEQLSEQVVSKALDASLIEQDENEDKLDKAIQLGQFAYNKSAIKRVDVVDNLYGLFHKYHSQNTSLAVSEGSGSNTSQAPLSVSLKPGGTIDALEFFSPYGPFLIQYKDSLVKCWPKLDDEKSIELGKNNDEWSTVEVGFSADGEWVQAITYDYREPRYIVDGELEEGPWLQVYAPATDIFGSIMPDSTEDFTYLGYFDFLAGRLVDEYGHSYTYEEFLAAFETILPTDYTGEFLISTDTSSSDTSFSFLSVSVDSLFSFVLMNERSGLLDTTQYQKARSMEWWGPAVHGKLDDLDQSKNIPIRRTNLSYSSYLDFRAWRSNQPDGTQYSLPINGDMLYFQAISENRFLAVGPGQELIMLRSDGGQWAADTLLDAQAGLLDLALSPSRQHIFAMTNELAFVSHLSGQLVTAYPHDNISSYSFSNDGHQLLTTSEDTVKVLSWQSDNSSPSLFHYSPAQDTTLPEATRIAMARFHENEGYLVIGLESRVQPPHLGGFFNWLKNLFKAGNKANIKKTEQPIRSNVLFWDYQRETIPLNTFEGPSGRLYDATVSKDGQYAVALLANKAVIIPKNKRMLTADSLTIEAANSKNLLRHGEFSTVRLSPGGKYIVRQSPGPPGFVELFTPSGKRVNTYRFQGGYQPGFNEQLFTPDDHFLIGAQSDEVLFWHPEDQGIKDWSRDYELYVDEKRENGLTTFMDEIPGTTDSSKKWSLKVLLAALVFFLLYYADFIIKAIQEKKYLEPAFYFLGFSLFGLILVLLWLEGAYFPETRIIVFYNVAWATLLLLSVGISGFREKLKKLVNTQPGGTFRQRLKYWTNQLPKYGTLLLFLAVGLFVLIGTVAFFRMENAKEANWELPLTGLLIPLLFAGLIGYPIYRLIQTYRANKLSNFYRWLLLPVGFMIIIFWAMYSGIVDDGYGDSNARLVSWASVLILLWIMARQSWKYLAGKKYVAFTVYAIPVTITLLMLSVSAIDASWAILFTLAMPAAFIYGRKYRQEGAYRQAFFQFSTVIFLVFGIFSWAAASSGEIAGAGIIMAVVLGLIFLGLQWQLKNRASRQATGKWTWTNWIAILGLWVTTIFTTATFTGAVIDYAYTPEEEYEEYYFPEEEWGMEADEEVLSIETGLASEAEQDVPYPEEAELGLQDSLAGNATGSQQTVSSEVDFNAPILNNRQQLIVQLFNPDAISRERALAELETHWTNDRALIPELIQYSSENPNKEEGLFETLDLLAVQSDQLLQNNRELLEPFLSRIAQMELGIEEQLKELQERMGY